MTALAQTLASVVIEAYSVFFQLYCRGAMQSSGAARKSGMEFSQSVMALTAGKHQWDDRTGSDADQDVQHEPFNKHRWSDGKKTMSIYTELDELFDRDEWTRATNAQIRGCCLPNRPATRHAAMDRPRVC